MGLEMAAKLKMASGRADVKQHSHDAASVKSNSMAAAVGPSPSHAAAALR
jgi:hypothetical protein